MTLTLTSIPCRAASRTGDTDDGLHSLLHLPLSHFVVFFYRLAFCPALALVLILVVVVWLLVFVVCSLVVLLLFLFRSW